MCECITHLAPILGAQSGLTLTLLFFYSEFDTSASKVTTVTHFEHTAIKIIVFYNDFEALISECENVSHIGLPYWVRSREITYFALHLTVNLTHSLKS